MDKVDHLLKLADEYEVMSVLDLCVKCLKDEPKTEQNAVRILYLANATVMAREDDRLDIARWNCTNLIKNMELKDIVGKIDFRNLDRDSLESVFREKTERLETLFKKIYPQIIGLAEFCILLCLKDSYSNITRCPQHFSSDDKATKGLIERMKTCPVCRNMIEQLVSCSKSSTTTTTTKKVYGSKGAPVSLFGSKPSKERMYGGNCHFNKNLISIIQDFENVIKSEFYTTVPFAFGASSGQAFQNRKQHGVCFFQF